MAATIPTSTNPTGLTNARDRSDAATPVAEREASRGSGVNARPLSGGEQAHHRPELSEALQFLAGNMRILLLVRRQRGHRVT